MARPTMQDLIARLTPRVQSAFLASMASIRSDVTLSAVEDAISRGDLEAVMRALRLETSYFRPLDDAFRAAVLAGGDQAVSDIKAIARRNAVAGRFDVSNPRAEVLIRDWSSQRVVEISGRVRADLRATLSEVMRVDASPRTVALDIVGRMDGGRRTGGLIGLTEQQAGWVRTAGSELRSGDPTQMGRYLERRTRDRRYDSIVRRAISNGRPVSADDARAMTGKMTGRLLRVRGEAIARTELLGGVHAAQAEALTQMIERGAVVEGAVTVEWDSASDSDTRDSHRAMDGMRQKQGEPFVSPITGAQMRHPGDTSLGAPASEIIQCRCHLRIRVDRVTGLRKRLSPEQLAETQAML